MNSNDSLNLDQIRESKIFVIDWAKFRNLVVLKLDELCALSVGITPTYARIIRDIVTFDQDELARYGYRNLKNREEKREKFFDEWALRVVVALNHVVAGTLPIVRADVPIVRTAAPISGYYPYEVITKDAESIELKIADFVAWATSLSWEMPDELKRMGQLPDGEDKPLTKRAETTYLNIIGALLDLLLGKSPSGKPYSVFESQNAIIEMLLTHHGGKPGIAERTLAEKFAAAKRSLNAT